MSLSTAATFSSVKDQYPDSAVNGHNQNRPITQMLPYSKTECFHFQIMITLTMIFLCDENYNKDYIWVVCEVKKNSKMG
jgi:hypothetical protein